MNDEDGFQREILSDVQSERTELKAKLLRAEYEIERFKGELLNDGIRTVADGPIDAEDSKSWALRQPYGGHAHVLVSQLVYIETKASVLARDLDQSLNLTRRAGEETRSWVHGYNSLKHRFRYQIAVGDWIKSKIWGKR